MKYRKAKLKDIAQGEVFEDKHSLLARVVWTGAGLPPPPQDALLILNMSLGIVGLLEENGQEYQVVGKLCGESGVEMYPGFRIEVPKQLRDCLVAIEPGTTGWEDDGDDCSPSNGTHFDPDWHHGDPLPEGTTHMLVTSR